MIGSILDRVTIRDVLPMAGCEEPNRGGYVRCVFHDDATASLHLVGPKDRETGFRCFGCEANGGVFDFLVQANVASDHAHAAQILQERFGGDLQPRTVAQYVYVNADGSPVGRVDRVEPGRDGRSKSFIQYRYEGGRFVSGLGGGFLPLYHADAVAKTAAAHGRAFVDEGEEKATP